MREVRGVRATFTLIGASGTFMLRLTRTGVFTTFGAFGAFAFGTRDGGTVGRACVRNPIALTSSMMIVVRVMRDPNERMFTMSSVLWVAQ